MTFYVQVYRSTDLNSPPISGQIGALLPVLNQCLVDGYGWSGMSITSLTRSGATATATVSAANGLKLKSGQILTISGVTGPGGGDAALYNGTFEITVTSTTTFTYVMTGTPSGTATGTIVCDNFLRINSITRGGIGNLTATVTSLNNNFTLLTGNWVTISGCTGTGASQYNGTFQITVTGSNTFTYQMSADPTADASGSPAYTKAGLQWTRPFAAGTNSQTYKSQATVGANGETYIPRYLQVIDNGVIAANQSEVYGAEIMQSDKIVLSGQFPTTVQKPTGGIVKKSNSISSTIRDWTLWGDEKTFTLGIVTGDYAPNHHGCLSFGYFISFKSGDLYNTIIQFSSSNAGNTHAGAFGVNFFAATPSTPNTATYIPKKYYQFGSPVNAWQTAPFTKTTQLYPIGGNNQTDFISIPNLPDGGFYVQPIFISDEGGQVRGRMPGVYAPMMTANSLTNYDVLTNIVGLSGVSLLNIQIVYTTYYGHMLIDQFGPWT